MSNAVQGLGDWAKDNPEAVAKFQAAAKIVGENLVREYIGGRAIRRLVNALTPLNLSPRQGRGIYTGLGWATFAVVYNFRTGWELAERAIDLFDTLDD